MKKTKNEAKTRQQIALEYGISARTLKRKLQQLNIPLPSGLLFPKDQDVIYQKLGKPAVSLKQS
jgi:transcriptional antiterminator